MRLKKLRAQYQAARNFKQLKLFALCLNLDINISIKDPPTHTTCSRGMQENFLGLKWCVLDVGEKADFTGGVPLFGHRRVAVFFPPSNN